MSSPLVQLATTLLHGVSLPGASTYRTRIWLLSVAASRSRENCMRTHCLRVLFEVNGYVIARQPARLLIAETQLISKICYATNSLKTQDALVSVVINHHDREFEPLGHGGDNLRVHHYIRSVADHHDNVSFRLG